MSPLKDLLGKISITGQSSLQSGQLKSGSPKHWLMVLRSLSGGAATLKDRERQLEEKLREALSAQDVRVEDTSGGCGTMYSILVVSDQFEGKNVVQQHRMVNAALADDVKGWHGLTIRTLAPTKS